MARNFRSGDRTTQEPIQPTIIEMAVSSLLDLRPKRLNGVPRVPKLPQVRYEGSIQHAKCSQEADAASIRREIGDKVEQVDHAIHVLMAAGMSTPALRDIARSVDIEYAAFAEMTGAMFLLGPFATNAIAMNVVCFFYNLHLWYSSVLGSASVLARLILFYLLCQSDWDEQRFILKVMNKFLFVAMLCWICLGASFWSFDMSVTAVSNIPDLWLLIGDSCLLAMLLFALLGIRGTAKLPFGFKILQFFFSRGSNKWSALNLCVRRKHAAFDLSTSGDESSDTNSDTSGSGSWGVASFTMCWAGDKA